MEKLFKQPKNGSFMKLKEAKPGMKVVFIRDCKIGRYKIPKDTRAMILEITEPSVLVETSTFYPGKVKLQIDDIVVEVEKGEFEKLPIIKT